MMGPTPVQADNLEGKALYCPQKVLIAGVQLESPEFTIGLAFGKPYPQAPGMGRIKILRLEKVGVATDETVYNINGIHHIDILHGVYRVDRRNLILNTAAHLNSVLTERKCELTSIPELNGKMKETLIRQHKKNKL